ncbi:hypothetical protein F4777DRAFT_600416 [Nemania sp. FL0916]|nr:hypothetical protein F4777DRAFT_600416 [Nemania sp. FL0916]
MSDNTMSDNYAPNWLPFFSPDGDVLPDVFFGVECQVCNKRLAICEPANNDDVEDFAVLPCGHAFGHECVSQWLRAAGNPNCPSCRDELPIGFIPRPIRLDGSNMKRAIEESLTGAGGLRDSKHGDAGSRQRPNPFAYLDHEEPPIPPMPMHESRFDRWRPPFPPGPGLFGPPLLGRSLADRARVIVSPGRGHNHHRRHHHHHDEDDDEDDDDDDDDDEDNDDYDYDHTRCGHDHLSCSRHRAPESGHSHSHHRHRHSHGHHSSSRHSHGHSRSHGSSRYRHEPSENSGLDLRAMVERDFMQNDPRAAMMSPRQRGAEIERLVRHVAARW